LKNTPVHDDDRDPHGEAWVALQQGAGVFLCIQCHKCSAGCPVSSGRDLQTSQIVRLAQIGDRETLFRSRSIWRCTGCHTCTTRCPAGVDPAGLQDRLKRLSLEMGRLPADNRSFEAADAFLMSVRSGGRLHELDMVRRFKQRTLTLFERLLLGLALFFRGKLRLSRSRMADAKAVRTLIDSERIGRHGK
jgi:heterodisulfide reductase subunit C